MPAPKDPIKYKKWKERVSKSLIGNKRCKGKTWKLSKETRLKYKKYGKDNNGWKGGKTISAGYILIRDKEHPFANCNGYVKKHRLVAEKCLGRYLTKEETIHHINGIKDDNRPKNLYLFASSSDHIAFENILIKPQLISNI